MNQEGQFFLYGTMMRMLTDVRESNRGICCDGHSHADRIHFTPFRISEETQHKPLTFIFGRPPSYTFISKVFVPELVEQIALHQHV